MLTYDVINLIRSERAILSNLFPDEEQFLNAAALYPGKHVEGRILFIPLKSEEEFEDIVHSSAVGCLARSYEITQEKGDDFVKECEAFTSEILRLCESFPSPIEVLGRKYCILRLSIKAKEPHVILREIGGIKEIKFDLIERGRSFLINKFKGNSDSLSLHLETLKVIQKKWHEFKLKFRDIELLQQSIVKETKVCVPSLSEIVEITEGSLNSGILVFAGKTQFKSSFKQLLNKMGTSDAIGVSEIVHSKNKPILTRVHGKYGSCPLVVLHEPNSYFASWVREIRSFMYSGDEIQRSLRYIDTVILDVCDIDYESEEARKQISDIKQQLALGEIRNVVCLVRTSRLTKLPGIMSRWDGTGRTDVPVQVWHVSKQQAAVLSNMPIPQQFHHNISPIRDSEFEEMQDLFRLQVDRVSRLVRELPGTVHIALLAALRELFFRFISFCDPGSFEDDASAFLKQLESLERHVSGAIYIPLRTNIEILLKGVSTFLHQQGHPLVAAAQKCLVESRSGKKKSFRLGVLSYNTNRTDQKYLTRYLTQLVAPGMAKPFRVEFFDAWNLPPALGSEPGPLKLLLCFNLPREFVTSLFFNRFARACVILSDKRTERTYYKSYEAVKGIHDQVITDAGLLKVLNLPDGRSNVICNGASCFDYSLASPTLKQDMSALGPVNPAEDSDDIETIISRLIKEKRLTFQEGIRGYRESSQATTLTLLLDNDDVLVVNASRKFYRIEDDNSEDSEAISVPASDLNPGDYIVLFRRSRREDLNALIDDSLAKDELYSNVLKISNQWREAIERINKAKRQHLQLNEVFQRAGFDRAPLTFENFLDGSTTKPLQLKELLDAINTVSRMMPGKEIPSFAPAEMHKIIEAVDQLSRVRRMLPRALRTAVINSRAGRQTQLDNTYGEISSRLIETVLQEVALRRIREIVSNYS